jgi:hypothetical protein
MGWATGILKGVLSRTLSRRHYATIRSTWSRYKGRQLERRLGLPEIGRAVAGVNGLTVVNGPFQGMKFTSRHLKCCNITAKLLGSYEEELSPFIVRIRQAEHALVVNVGCAEGYYSVGFALCFPKAVVHAFDTNLAARRLCSKLARANGVADRVVIRDWCSHYTLQKLLQGRRDVLLFCDVEGFELELLQPDLVPGLRSCNILVETHDMLEPGVTDTICARFAESHTIDLMACRDRDPDVYPALHFLADEDRHLALSELRDMSQRWAFMTPRGSC